MTGYVSEGKILEINAYIGEWSGTTAPTSFFGPVNFTKLEAAPGETSIQNRPSRRQIDAGQSLNSVSKTGPYTLNGETDDAGQEILRLQLLGTTSAVTQSANSETGEAVTLVENKWVPLSRQNLVSGTATIATKTEGTDFQLDYQAGLIMALNAGCAGAQTVAYDYADIAAKKTTAGTEQTKVLQLRLSGVNSATGKKVWAKVHQWDCKPQGGWDALSEEFVKTVLNGTMTTPSGENGPLEWIDET